MNEKSNEPDPLRTATMAQLPHTRDITVPFRSTEELLHELQVHRIELEMQNEELHRAQAALEASRDHYVDLYEFSPVGYLTLNHDGIIEEINLSGAKILGIDRNNLLLKHFAAFIATEECERWHLHFQNVLKSDRKLTCELSYRCGDESGFYARLDCMRQDKFGKIPVVKIALTDITDHKRVENNMQESEAGYRALFENMLDGYAYCKMLYDDQNRPVDFVYINVNEAFVRQTGMKNVVGKAVSEVIPGIKEQNPELFEFYGRVISTGIPEVFDFDLKLLGKCFTISVYSPKEKHFVAVFCDITKRKHADEELRIAATAFEAQEGMTITDADGTILRVNSAFTNITGYTAEEAVGKNPRLLQSGQHDEAFYAAMWQSINSAGVWKGEIWNKRKNGEIYPERLSITAVKNGDGIVTNYVATFTDIAEIIATINENKSLAFYDPLTKLPNRRLLFDRLQQAISSSARSGSENALLIIDLDNFKNLNDTLGHDIGDLLLKQVAQRLVSCVRVGDTVARLGGDEFVVMLENLNDYVLGTAAQMEIIGKKILDTICTPYQIGSHECYSSPSIGVTVFKGLEFGLEELLKQADIAMYQAKKDGRNTLRFFDPQMQNTINARVAIEKELRNAIKNQQLHLYYQIQVDGSHRAVGAEALIRWIHPELGLVSPAQFIPMAEETGVILPIGQWVLDTACAQLKAWQKHKITRNLALAVNVSAKQFRQPDFAENVQALVHRHDFNPTLLKLELTESLLLENIEDTIATMNALNNIGVRFSLDDFGTGYSSLQYLKRLPLDQLKIDQSFVRDIATDNSDKAIVKTIIAMAHSLKLGVIAEGVETEEQRKFLKKNDCNHYQGYLFGKPVPIEQFEELLRL